MLRRSGNAREWQAEVWGARAKRPRESVWTKRASARTRLSHVRFLQSWSNATRISPPTWSARESGLVHHGLHRLDRSDGIPLFSV